MNIKLEDLSNDEIKILYEMAEEEGFSDVKKFLNFIQADTILKDKSLLEIKKMLQKKRKPRHFPNKKQNKYGSVCRYYECFTRDDGTKVEWCEGAGWGHSSIGKCKGNPHNCIKDKYSLEASKGIPKVGSDKKRKIY